MSAPGEGDRNSLRTEEIYDRPKPGVKTTQIGTMFFTIFYLDT